MSKDLAHLLDRTEEELGRVVAQLEALAGYPREDIKLLLDVRRQTTEQLRSIGLDPSDTTAAELHGALMHQASKDNEHLSRALGVESTADDKLSESLVRAASAAGIEGWYLKKTQAKALLRQNPPKKLMKKLGYRSADSMLKRENISEVYAAAAFVESRRWQQDFWRSHRELHSTDFETRPVEYIAMPGHRWADSGYDTGLVTCLLPIGSVAVWPVPARLPAKALCLGVLLFEAAETTRLYSTVLKTEQLSPSFGIKILELMQPKMYSPLKLAGLSMEWDILHRHFSQSHENLPAFLDTHLTKREMGQHTAAEHMSALHPAFRRWLNRHTAVHLTKGRPVSLNLSDVVAAVLGRPYTLQAAGKAAWHELILRYMDSDGVKLHLLSQLDTAEERGETIRDNLKHNRKNPLAMIQAEFA